MAKRKPRTGARSAPTGPEALGNEPERVVVAGEADRAAVGTPLLFCPFCREAFEGAASCPDHDLKLVSWDELDEAETDELRDDDAVSPVDLRFGRGELLAGVVLSMLSVLSPLFTVAQGEDSRTFSLLAAATDRVPNLWTIPFVAALVLSVTLRRRTIRQMLGARLAILILATGPLLSLGYTLFKMHHDAAELGAALHLSVEVTTDWGAGLVVAGAVLIGIGAMRLGVQRATVRGPKHVDG